MAKRFIPLLILFCLLFSACASPTVSDDTNSSKLHIVTSSYPAFDFAKAIAGEHAQISMLAKPGIDPHEYEPTPQNLIDLENCAFFLYNGGHSDAWVEKLLGSVENPDLTALQMMDCVTVLEEEVIDGMTAESHDHEEDHGHDAEYDEHVWMSPRNVMEIAKAICDTLCDLDPEHTADYQANLEQYLADLAALDEHLVGIVFSAARHTVVFADRFPARYFTEAYDLTYFAAFPGCSSQTEPDAATVAFLIEKIKAEEIPVIFRVPYSSSTLPEIISEETGAEILLFHSFHNVSADEFGSLTYLDVMYQNAEALAAALGNK